MSEVLARMRAFREGLGNEPIKIPQWKIDAFVKQISGLEHAHIKKLYGGSQLRLVVQLIMHCLVDEEGKRVIPDTLDAMQEIEAQPAGLIDRIADEVWAKSGLGQTLDEAKN